MQIAHVHVCTYTLLLVAVYIVHMVHAKKVPVSVLHTGCCRATQFCKPGVNGSSTEWSVQCFPLAWVSLAMCTIISQHSGAGNEVLVAHLG